MGDRFYTGMPGPHAVRALNELDAAAQAALDGAAEIVEQAEAARDTTLGYRNQANDYRAIAVAAGLTATEKAAQVESARQAVVATGATVEQARAAAVAAAADTHADREAVEQLVDDGVEAIGAAKTAALTQIEIETGKTAADRVATGQDRVATGQDRTAVVTARGDAVTAADTAKTKAEATAADALATAADRVATGQDRSAVATARGDAVAAAGTATTKALATAADALATGQDKQATSADRVATGQDRAAATKAAGTATTKAEEAAAAASAAADVLAQVLAHGNGWTPIIATLVDGERRVQGILAWFGGTGQAPATGFIGPTGIVASAAQATDVRGGRGTDGEGTGTANSVNGVLAIEGDIPLGIEDIPNLVSSLAAKVSGPAVSVDSVLAAFDGTTGKAIKSVGYAAIQQVGAFQAGLGISGQAGQGKVISLRTGPNYRWEFGADEVEETGSNAGSNWYLSRFSDAGAWLGTVLSANRATGQVYVPNFKVDNPIMQGTPHLTGAAGSERLVAFETEGVLRWKAGASAIAEAGSNSGSDYAVYRYTDTGAYLGMAMEIKRATGAVSLSGALSVDSGVLALNPTTNGNANIELGAMRGVASTPYVDWHSSATANDFDFRMIANGGGASSGGGTLKMLGFSLDLRTLAYVFAPTAPVGSSGTEVANAAFVLRLARLKNIVALTGDVDLTDAQAECSAIDFTGTLTADAVVKVPGFGPNSWTVYNGTTGGFQLTIKGAGSTTVVIPSLTRRLVRHDGANVYVQDDSAVRDIAEVAATKANLISPALTGTPTAPTAAFGTNNTQLATTAYAVAAAAGKADRASPTFTGVPAAPTAAVGTATTQLATTAFVQNENRRLVTSLAASELTVAMWGQRLRVGTIVISSNASTFPIGWWCEIEGGTSIASMTYSFGRAVNDSFNMLLLYPGERVKLVADGAGHFSIVGLSPVVTILDQAVDAGTSQVDIAIGDERLTEYEIDVEQCTTSASATLTAILAYSSSSELTSGYQQESWYGNSSTATLARTLVNGGASWQLAIGNTAASSVVFGARIRLRNDPTFLGTDAEWTAANVSTTTSQNNSTRATGRVVPAQAPKILRLRPSFGTLAIGRLRVRGIRRSEA